MAQPIPPGDMPLFEGLGTEWNDVVGALPEDRRSELAPKIKERLDSFAPLKAYEDFHKSGITPDKLGTALNLQQFIEANPRQVYDAIGNFLGISPQEAKQVVEDSQQDEDVTGPAEDPRIKTLQDQVNTLAQITLTKNQQERQAQLAAEMDASIDKEITDLKKKYGNDINEDEILMRMASKTISAEQAYQEFMALADQLRRRPAPFLLGNGGVVPHNRIDPTKLDGKETRNLVAQMMQQAVLEGKQ